MNVATTGRKRRHIRWSLLWAVLIVGLTAWLIIAERHQVVQALPILQHADYAVLIVTGLCEVLFFALQAMSARLLYGLYDRRVSVPKLTAVLFHATMVNEVLPTSGVSGTASFVYWGDRLGYGLRDSIAVNIWMTILSYIALIPVVVVCARTLWLLPATDARVVLGTLELALVFLALIALSFWVWRHFSRRNRNEQDLQPAATKDMTNTPHLGYYVSKGWRSGLSRMKTEAFSYTQSELSKEWSKTGSHPIPLAVATVLLVAIYAVRVLMVKLCFAAVGHPLGIDVAMYVYSLTLLVSVVSLVPTTLGVVEVAMTTALSWFGVPLPFAIAGTILYRLSSFWLPIPAGLVCQWWLTRASVGQRVATSDSD